ncbi:MAG TPA: Rieske 2Fe-2S domain-containing protein [Terriglobales bacterium]|nr:Rieske 2Fe-2S domain-containing protein [Terriglobales bacterium]
MNLANCIRIWDIDCPLPTEVLLNNAVQHIESGDILLVRRALQRVGLWEEIQTTVWGAIGDALGHEMTARLRELGLGSMHQLLTGDQVKRCNEFAHARFNAVAEGYVPRLVREAIGHRGPGFFDQNAVIRFYVPIAFHKSNRETLDTRPGYTKPQGPHIDTWFGHAMSGLNLWMALEPVRRGNGLALFLTKWRSEIPHDDNCRPLRGQHFGTPVTFQMDPGDLLFFHGEHLHSSELNSTAWTRVVLTNRFSLRSPPTVPEISTKWLELPTSNPAQNTVRLEDTARSYSVEEFRRLYAPASGDGTITALDDRWCEVMTNGSRRIVSRICPHEGGDLSAGYVENGRIYCPWHHMSFDPTTGQPPCGGIAPLRIGDEPRAT